jgi:hypothetical protein
MILAVLSIDKYSQEIIYLGDMAINSPKDLLPASGRIVRKFVRNLCTDGNCTSFQELHACFRSSPIARESWRQA